MPLVGIITVSDRSSSGLREDASGPGLKIWLESRGFIVSRLEIVPDEIEDIARALIDSCEIHHMDIVITTGGTGVAPRDVTPEATLQVVDKLVPGMAEAMRAASLTKTPHAMISRAVVGIRGKTLIINLPGSPKGAIENIEAVAPALNHAVDKIKGDPSDCA